MYITPRNFPLPRAPVCSVHHPQKPNPASWKVSAMVSGAFRKQLLPFVSLEYGSRGDVSLDERLLYVEHYRAYHEVTKYYCDCCSNLQGCGYPHRRRASFRDTQLGWLSSDGAVFIKLLSRSPGSTRKNVYPARYRRRGFYLSPPPVRARFSVCVKVMGRYLSVTTGSRDQASVRTHQ